MKQSFRWTKIDVVSVLVGAAVVLTIGVGIADRQAAVKLTVQPPTVVVDAGHGGEDGGTETDGGVPEKTINLAIAKPLGDWLTVMGYTVSYTRTTDTMVAATGDTLRERKISDMRNRLAAFEQADMAISIHQNHFAESRYSGTQVFYGTRSPGSQGLAQAIQSTVVESLQPHNTRQVKAGDRSVYLLAHATKPTVLVECGFLSNVEEAKKLQERVYQRQMALAIAFGILSV